MDGKEIKKELLLAVILLIASAAILIKGYSYEPESRQFPVFLGWLFLIFSVLFSVRLIPDLSKLRIPSVQNTKSSFLPLVVLAAVSLYTLLLPWFGYYPTTAAFLLLFMFLCGRNKKNAKTYLLAAAVFLACIYVFFSLVLGTRLPIGELWTNFGA